MKYRAGGQQPNQALLQFKATFTYINPSGLITFALPLGHV